MPALDEKGQTQLMRPWDRRRRRALPVLRPGDAATVPANTLPLDLLSAKLPAGDLGNKLLTTLNATQEKPEAVPLTWAGKYRTQRNQSTLLGNDPNNPTQESGER